MSKWRDRYAQQQTEETEKYYLLLSTRSDILKAMVKLASGKQHQVRWMPLIYQIASRSPYVDLATCVREESKAEKPSPSSKAHKSFAAIKVEDEDSTQSTAKTAF